MGYPEDGEFPIEWFLEEVDRVEVSQESVKVRGEEEIEEASK